MSGNKDSGYDHNCRWIITPALPGLTDGVYCEKKVGWKIVTEEDGEKYRHYDSFCKEHKAKAEAMKDE